MDTPIASRSFLLAVTAAASFMLSAVSAGADGPLLLERHQAAGVRCASCHKEEPPHTKPLNGVCVGCHGDQEKLAGLSSKATPNPHAPPHLAPGETQACDDCHHVHRPSEVSCADCHHSFQFDVK